jgi:4-hydroxy-tetrahydrodipicolinate synthase
VAVKEASGDLEQIMEIIRDKPAHFEVISGDDALTFPILAVGGYGVISVVGQAFPKTFSEMVNYGLSKKMKKANERHYALLHVTQLLFAEGNPGGLKAALKLRGICKEHVRLPLYKVSKALENKIASEIEKIGE